MIIPHIIDQYVWNKIVTDSGAGPKGVKIYKVSTKNLEPLIVDLMNNAEYKKKSEQIGKEMAGEDFREALYNSIIE